MHYHWDLAMVLADTDRWWHGIGITLLYSIATIAGGIVIGVFCGLALLGQKRWLTLPLEGYVEIFRCTPLLIQIVWFYYALPILLKFSLPAWLAAGLGLTLYMGAFCTEIFRAGVMSIGRGQWQAGRALGMTYAQLMRRIVLPQAVRRMIPPLVNQSITQLKNTALLYVVAVPDLIYTSSIITAETYRPLEVYTSAAVIYFIMLYPLTLFAKRLETRVDRKPRPTPPDDRGHRPGEELRPGAGCARRFPRRCQGRGGGADRTERMRQINLTALRPS